MRERVDLKSPVRENRPPGSVRGAPGNRRPYRDSKAGDFLFLSGGAWLRLQPCIVLLPPGRPLNRWMRFGG